jgi:hypothetical protein
VQEDQRKLHSEILQTINQRFLTTTAAVTLFGVVTSVAAQNARSERLVLLLSAILTTSLFVLYVHSHFLRKATLTLATYLVLRGWSEYEQDLAEYRRQAPHKALFGSYTNAQTPIFLALTIAGAALPYLVAFAGERQIEYDCATHAAGIVGLVFAFMIAGMGFRSWFIESEDIEKKWRHILRGSGRIGG